MNQNLNVISRRSYYILDIISSFGGLQAALILILGVFYKLWTVNEFDNWLVQNLFKAEKTIVGKSPPHDVVVYSPKYKVHVL